MFIVEEFECNYDNPLLSHINKLNDPGNKVIGKWDSIKLDFSTPEDLIFQGSIFTMKKLIRNGWPNVWYDKHVFDCVGYYPHIGEYLINDDYVMLPMGDISRRKDWLYKTFGIDGCIFIRPNSNEKSFTGGILEEERFMGNFDVVIANEYDTKDSLVIVSSPKIIKAEYRFVVIDGEVITGSQYKRNNELYISTDVPDGAYALAETIVDKWDPYEAFVVDVAYDGEHYKLMEVGSFNCAGLYACDGEKIYNKFKSV